MAAKLHIGNLPVAPPPRVVGVISALSSVSGLLESARRPCDLVELRLDQMATEPEAWRTSIHRLQGAGYPVLATLRLAAEGGNWTAPDADRWPLIEQMLAVASAVDVELRSPLLVPTVKHAAQAGKVVVASYHDFAQTPTDAELLAVLKQGATHGPQVIIKLAVQINHDADRIRLQALLTDPPVTNPLCIIGMGPIGAGTRLTFPGLGSCLAYGHIDGATAPGQWSCHELQQRLSSTPDPKDQKDYTHADS